MRSIPDNNRNVEEDGAEGWRGGGGGVNGIKVMILVIILVMALVVISLVVVVNAETFCYSHSHLKKKLVSFDTSRRGVATSLTGLQK